jgi:hypothetical protein
LIGEREAVTNLFAGATDMQKSGGHRHLSGIAVSVPAYGL